MRIRVTTTDGATALEQVTHSDRNEFDPAASPDAKALAYEVAASPEAPPHVEVLSLSDRRVAVRYDQAVGFEPAWLPDGTSLVFVSNALGRHGLVQTIGPVTEQGAFLASAGDPYHFAAWPALSPDGRRMAMSLVQTDVFLTGWRTTQALDPALGVSDLHGTGVTVLGPGTDPAWSPDGTRIAFSRVVGGHAHLFVAKADGTGAQQITDGSDEDEQPAWAPDGKYLAFCSARGRDDRPSQANLFVVSADGSGLVQLTEGDRVACRPNWARDGFIYFHANATEAYHIWRLRPRGAFADAHLDAPPLPPAPLSTIAALVGKAPQGNAGCAPMWIDSCAPPYDKLPPFEPSPDGMSNRAKSE